MTERSRSPRQASRAASTGGDGPRPDDGLVRRATTLVGDVNGDGKVEPRGPPGLRPDLHVPGEEAQATIPPPTSTRTASSTCTTPRRCCRNLAPISPRIPLAVELHLAPADQAHYSHPTISGGATFHRTVTIVGRTTPGSLIIEDNHTSRLPGGTQAYKFTGPAHATDAQGFFSIKATNTEGLNNNDFLILDPFGRQVIRDFPIFWIPFATGKGEPR